MGGGVLMGWGARSNVRIESREGMKTTNKAGNRQKHIFNNMVTNKRKNIGVEVYKSIAIMNNEAKI